MPKKVKRYLITDETHEVYIVRNEGARIHGFCAECGKESEMLNLDSAALLTRTGTREIFRLVEADKIHSIETTDGLLLVCRNSLEGEIR